MNYPLISEYIESIKAAEDNLNQLSYLRPVLNGDGQPVMSSGNFAVVFKMKDEQTGKLHALKCFLKEQEGRAEAYKEIAKELENVSSTFLTPIKYYENELFVDSNATEDIEFPVLLMDWVEGVPLDKYVRDNIDDSYELELLTWNFKLLAVWLLEQPFAHGDLKPDNIIVHNDGTMVLVDYDGMYVPAMEGQCSRELGSPDFRHPQRTEQDFDKRIDDFPIVSIALSLKAIALEPELLERYGAKDRLLFSEADYRDLGNCSFVKEHFPSQSPELDMLYALFLLVWRDSKQQGNSISAIMETAIRQPELPIENTYSTEVTREDLANAWVDENGAKYSADRRRLLKGPNFNKYPTFNKYSILKETLVIGDRAFAECEELHSIVIPSSVTQIGDSAFKRCWNLESIVIPDSVKKIGKSAFELCRNLKSIVIPSSVTKIGDLAFLWCSNLQSISISDSVTKIGNGIFSGCESLQSIIVAKGNKKYDSRDNCNAIIETASNKLIVGCATTQIPDTITQIGARAFGHSNSLYSVFIPNSVTKIEDGAFHSFADSCDLLYIEVAEGNNRYDSRNNCNSIIETKSNTLMVGCSRTVIPDSVTQIGNYAFLGCHELHSIVIPDSVKQIGDYAFYDCMYLQSIVIPNSVIKIGDFAFSGCDSLQSIIIPNSVTHIGNAAISNCVSLQSIVIPSSVTKIGKEAFCACIRLQSIVIPDSVKQIGDGAFYWCDNLRSIVIPKGSKEKFQELLPDYKHLLREQ